MEDGKQKSKYLGREDDMPEISGTGETSERQT
jgi:hypothetical protein